MSRSSTGAIQGCARFVQTWQVGATTEVSSRVPGKPEEPVAEARGPDRIVVTWKAPEDCGGREITGYMVEISTDDRATWAPPSGFNARASEGLLARTFEDRNIPESGVTRYYRVSAMNPVGTGAASDVARAMTTAETPDEPTMLTAAAMKDPVGPVFFPPLPTARVRGWRRPRPDGGSGTATLGSPALKAGV